MALLLDQIHIPSQMAFAVPHRSSPRRSTVSETPSSERLSSELDSIPNSHNLTDWKLVPIHLHPWAMNCKLGLTCNQIKIQFLDHTGHMPQAEKLRGATGDYVGEHRLWKSHRGQKVVLKKSATDTHLKWCWWILRTLTAFLYFHKTLKFKKRRKGFWR